MKRWLSALAIVVVAVGLGYAAFNAYRRSQPELCYASQRPVHAQTRTVAMVGGRPRVFCCPACALTEREQEGKPVQITELTDFLTGAKLSPAEAIVVKSSDVNMCARMKGFMSEEKRVADVRYDRCSPSILAFAHRTDARQFAREHGGEVVPFSEIVSEFRH